MSGSNPAVSAVRPHRARLRRQIPEIDQILRELEQAIEALPAPSPAEYERMIAGTASVPPEALLLGALKAVSFHLEEVCGTIEDYFDHRPSCLRRGLVTRELLQQLGHVVRTRARVHPPAGSSGAEGRAGRRPAARR